MTRKHNSISTRLNIIKVHNILAQRYGNDFTIYRLFLFIYLNSIKFIMKFFKNTNNFLNFIEIWHKYKLIRIKLYLQNNYSKHSLKFFILSLLNYWFFSKKEIKIYLFLNIFRGNTVLLLSSYIIHLHEKYNYTLKKLIAILAILLNKKINTLKIIYSKNGPLRVMFKGYKITIQGRFETTKNTMSKQYTLINGSLKAIKINNHIEYTDIILSTKLGLANIKLWLFYETLN